MKKPIQISGKNLGALAMPDACPRCFWIKNNCKLPYQIFPGIFASLDIYVKKVVHAYFDEYHSAPPWLPELQKAGAVKCLPTPHWSKFKRTDPATGITVTGAMDDLFLCEDGDLVLPDYKTAKLTENADKLAPLYAGQLNSYRWIQEGFGQGRVKALPLIYCEPVTDFSPTMTEGQHYTPDGYTLLFRTKEVPVALDDGMVTALLVKAAWILEQAFPPAAAKGCEDCEKLDALINATEIYEVEPAG
jgi:hypothetical protein